MSGIAALAVTHEPPARNGQLQDSLTCILGALAHRGGVTLPSNPRPSTVLREARGIGRGSIWLDAQCALGVQHHVQSREGVAETQPLRDAPSGCVLVWDGWLDNREELAAALDAPELSVPDSELVLRAYLRWGEECPARLLGDFAFAVWNPRRQQLFAARDVMGVRPLFYHAGEGWLALASEVQALLRLPALPRVPDEVMAGDALLGWTDFSSVQRAFYRAVRRLPPAHWLRWDAGRLVVQRYWDIDPGRRIRRKRREEYHEEYAALLRQAVACRLRTVRPVGVFLSGGMDSAAVASLIGRLKPAAGAHTFHMRLVDDRNDEHVFAQLAARHASLPLHTVPLWGDNVLDELESFVRLHHAPFGELTLANDLTLLRLAASEGSRVVFTGDGSDEVSNFPPAYVADLVRSGRWLRLARTLGPYARYLGHSPRRFLLNSLRYTVPRTLQWLWKQAKWRHAPEWINPDFARQSGMLERLRAVPPVARFSSLSAQTDYATLTRGRRILVDERRQLEAARLGLEYRFPFYDRRMVEFMLAVPWEEKVSGWHVKSLLRHAPGVLPEELKQRPRKANYGQYSARLWRAQDWQSLRAVFENPPESAAQYVRLPSVCRMARRFLQDRQPSEPGGFTVLNLAIFFLWLKTTVQPAGTTH